MTTYRWIVAQIGAREHYAVARAFHRRGQLAALYTEAWCRWGSRLLQNAPNPLRGLAGRFQPELRSANVVSFTLGTLLEETWRACRRPKSTQESFRRHTDIGRAFALRVNHHLRGMKIDPASHAYFGYNTGCLETLEILRNQGVTTVVDQIDPGRTEEELVFQESQKWPGWQVMPGRIPDFYYDRLAREWELASVVLVNSAWSKSALVQQGVPERQIVVVPLAYEPVGDTTPKQHQPRTGGTGPLVVLWLGSVILRKGIQYLLQAARLLKDHPIEIIVAGPIGIAKSVVAGAPKNVRFVGRVDRDRAADFYRAADVFVLPTISDGFATTQLEAMSHGLPVIATPNCGEVVTHEQDGLIVPAYDAAALARAIARLDADRPLLLEMSRCASHKCKQFSLQHYAEQVEAAAEECRQQS